MILADQCDFCERSIDTRNPWIVEMDEVEQRQLDVCTPCALIPKEDRWRKK